ncbi:MAG: trypsin-like peptidase domain-containing protein [Planctomycetes bacterium]|nr:trypsin-like peptidase domain-containing protein [Planctomycetota bacterium]
MKPFRLGAARGVFAFPMWILMLAGMVLGSARASAGDEADYEKLVSEKSPAVVTVKFVMKIKGAQGEAESEGETSGVMIEAEGIVLCSNSQLGGGPMVRQGVSATPTEIKVLIGDDTQGIDARLIARDSELDLSWLRSKEPGDKKFAHVDLAAKTTPRPGDRIYSLVRLGKFFDRAISVRESRLGGVAKKPRQLLIPSPSLGDLGLPVFSASGEFVGLTVVQLPDAEELQAATSMTPYTGARGLILPAAEIAKATARAKEADEKGDAAPKAEDESEKPKTP